MFSVYHVINVKAGGIHLVPAAERASAAEMESILSSPLVLVNFGFLEIYSYAEELNKLSNSNFSVISEQKKGLIMFKEEFVSNIKFQKVGDCFKIEAKVKAEMRKGTVYLVTAEVKDNNEVLNCHCLCPAGSSPASCKHAFALLHALEDYSRQELYLAPTDKLQVWHKPKVTKFSPKKCSEIFGKKRCIQPVKPVNVSALLKDNMNLQFLSVFSPVYEEAHKFTPPLPACVITASTSLIFEEKLPTKLWKSLLFDIEAMWLLEQNTMEQSSSEQWRKERLLRLTASKFHDIFTRRSDFDKLCAQIYHAQNLNISLPAVIYGRDNESIARNYVRTVFSNSYIRKVGLVTHPLMPHLAASPDGIIHSSDDTFLVEIKCVFNITNKPLEELAKNPNFCLANENGKYALKKRHRYYTQIQGQLALSNLKECVFVLFYMQPNHIYLEHIKFDEGLWNSVFSKLNFFYFEHYAPYLEKTHKFSI